MCPEKTLDYSDNRRDRHNGEQKREVFGHNEEERIQYQCFGAFYQAGRHGDGGIAVGRGTAFLEYRGKNHPGRGVHVEYGEQQYQRYRTGASGAPPDSDRDRRIDRKIDDQINIPAKIALQVSRPGDISVETVEDSIDDKKGESGDRSTVRGQNRRGESRGKREQRNRRRVYLCWNDADAPSENSVLQSSRAVIEQTFLAFVLNVTMKRL